jgi:tetratricopeptide (TPR) repeat protein
MPSSSATEDPYDSDVKVLVAVFRTSLGLTLAKRARRDALPVYEKALADYAALPSELRQSTYGRQNEFMLHCAMAPALAVAGRSDAPARAQQGLALAVSGGPNDAFNRAMCESLVAQMSYKLGDSAKAIEHFESVVRTLTPMADKPDTSALVGLVDALQQLAVLRPADACSRHKQALEHWKSRPATTPYLRRRADELDAVVDRCKTPR